MADLCKCCFLFLECPFICPLCIELLLIIWNNSNAISFVMFLDSPKPWLNHSMFWQHFRHTPIIRAIMCSLIIYVLVFHTTYESLQEKKSVSQKQALFQCIVFISPCWLSKLISIHANIHILMHIHAYICLTYVYVYTAFYRLIGFIIYWNIINGYVII